MLNLQQIQSLQASKPSPSQGSGSYTPSNGAPMNDEQFKGWLGGGNSQQPGMMSRMGSDIQSSGQGVNDAISGTGKYQGASTLNRATGATSEAFSAIPKVASEALPGIAREGISKVGDAASSVINWLGDKVSNIKPLQEWASDPKNADAVNKLSDALGTATNLGNISGTILATDAAAKIGNAGVNAVKGLKPPDANSAIINAQNRVNQYDALIKSGDATPESVYSNVETKTFKPDIAKQVIQDTVDTMKEHGFKDATTSKLEGMVDSSNLTPDSMMKAVKTLTDSTAKEGIVGGIKNVMDSANEKMGALSEKIAPTDTVDQVTGKVLQGKTGDIQSGKSGLSSLDTSKVKTYKDLTKLSNDKISELSKAQDANLAKNPTPHYLSEFDKTIGEGTSAIKMNYVKEAISNLKELYTNTSDAKGLSRIKAIEAKVNGVVGTDGKVMSNATGLTAKEVNDLARNYGSEFGSKAFGKTGEALTSVNATKFENIRTGLKNSARDLLPDDASRALDKQMSDIYTVRDLSSKMTEKVNTLTQRLQKPNILQKIGGIVGKGLRITGAGDLASKLLGIDKVPGAQTLNAVELEAKLSKNLSKIDAAMKKGDAGFAKDVGQILQTDAIDNAPKAETSKTGVDDANNSLARKTGLKNTQGGSTKNPAALLFNKFHPEDQSFLKDFATKVKNKEPIPESLLNRAKETLMSYGYTAPNAKTNLANVIMNASDSADERSFNEEADKNLRGQ